MTNELPKEWEEWISEKMHEPFGEPDCVNVCDLKEFLRKIHKEQQDKIKKLEDQIQDLKYEVMDANSRGE